MSSPESRRSQRIRNCQARKPPIEVITISSSSDEDEGISDNRYEQTVSSAEHTSSGTKRKTNEKNERGRLPPSTSPNNSSSDLGSQHTGDGSFENSTRLQNLDRETTKHTDVDLPESVVHTSVTNPETTADHQNIAAQQVQHSSCTASPSPMLGSDVSFPSPTPNTPDEQMDDIEEEPENSDTVRSTKPTSTKLIRPEHIIDRVTDTNSLDINYNDVIDRLNRRRLVLEKIIGAIRTNNNSVEFVVRWKGITRLERIPMAELKFLFPEKLIDFMCQRIRWSKEPAKKRGRPPKVTAL